MGINWACVDHLFKDTMQARMPSIPGDRPEMKAHTSGQM